MIDPINIIPVGGGVFTLPAGRSPQSPGPCITQQPVAKAVSNDFTFYIEILTQGDGTTYQWQALDWAGEAGWADIDIGAFGGVRSSQLINPLFAASDINAIANGYPSAYRCNVTRNGVTISSNPIECPGAIILDNPTGGTFGTVSGQIHMAPEITTTVSSLLLGIGYTPIGSTWQWYKNGVPLAEGINSGTGDNTEGGSSGTFTEDAVLQYNLMGIAGTDPQGTYMVVITAPNGIRTASAGAVWTPAP